MPSIVVKVFRVLCRRSPAISSNTRQIYSIRNPKLWPHSDDKALGFWIRPLQQVMPRRFGRPLWCPRTEFVGLEAHGSADIGAQSSAEATTYSSLPCEWRS